MTQDALFSAPNSGPKKKTGRARGFKLADPEGMTERRVAAMDAKREAKWSQRLLSQQQKMLLTPDWMIAPTGDVRQTTREINGRKYARAATPGRAKTEWWFALDRNPDDRWITLDQDGERVDTQMTRLATSIMAHARAQRSPGRFPAVEMKDFVIGLYRQHPTGRKGAAVRPLRADRANVVKKSALTWRVEVGDLVSVDQSLYRVREYLPEHQVPYGPRYALVADDLESSLPYCEDETRSLKLLERLISEGHTRLAPIFAEFETARQFGVYANRRTLNGFARPFEAAARGVTTWIISVPAEIKPDDHVLRRLGIAMSAIAGQLGTWSATRLDPDAWPAIGAYAAHKAAWIIHADGRENSAAAARARIGSVVNDFPFLAGTEIVW